MTAATTTTYIGLLRGINVGGNRKFLMADVKAAMVEAGAGDVQTYIQSGNIVFTHPARPVAALTAEIEQHLATAAGFGVPVMLRTAAQWAAIIDGNPFAGEDPATLHVACLAGPAAATATAVLDKAKVDPEQFAIVGPEIYLHLPNGLGRSKLAAALDKVGVPATARNWRTVLKLREMTAG